MLKVRTVLMKSNSYQSIISNRFFFRPSWSSKSQKVRIIWHFPQNLPNKKRLLNTINKSLFFKYNFAFYYLNLICLLCYKVCCTCLMSLILDLRGRPLFEDRLVLWVSWESSSKWEAVFLSLLSLDSESSDSDDEVSELEPDLDPDSESLSSELEPLLI